MAQSETKLPAAHELAAEAVRFGLPEGNRHGFQVIIERWLGVKAETPRGKKATHGKGRSIAWKAHGPMRSGGCGQCGDIPTRHQNCGPHVALCERCFAVLETSRKWWKPNDEFPSAG